MQHFDVKGMTCGHCARAVTEAIQAHDAQAQVTVDVPHGKVSVASSLDTTTLLALIQQEGFSASEVL